MKGQQINFIASNKMLTTSSLAFIRVDMSRKKIPKRTAYEHDICYCVRFIHDDERTAHKQDWILLSNTEFHDDVLQGGKSRLETITLQRN